MTLHPSSHRHQPTHKKLPLSSYEDVYFHFFQNKSVHKKYHPLQYVNNLANTSIEILPIESFIEKNFQHALSISFS